MTGPGSRAGDFAIEAFRPDAAALLGEGLWGRVYDLGDGTVLKVARVHCAGIGDGRRKIENEHAGLALLSGSALRDIVALPRGRGAIAPSSPLAAEGFAVWLRSTQLPGACLSWQAVERLPAPRQLDLGTKIGTILARLHAALDRAAAASAATIPAGDDYAELIAAADKIGDPTYVDAIRTLARARARIPAPMRARPCHGDFNISNLLLGPAGEICGIVDFAEWGANFPEKDISDIVNELPALRAPLQRAYEAESGMAVDPARLALGIAENALCGAVIGERSGDQESVTCGRALLREQLKKLE